MNIKILLPYKEQFTSNKASAVSLTVKNSLEYSNLINNNGLRNVDLIDNILTSQFSLSKTIDFEKVTSARKLNTDEYEINKTLGYISLLRRLQNDEVLAVSYEYTYNGNRYKVGELTEDYQNRDESEIIWNGKNQHVLLMVLNQPWQLLLFFLFQYHLQ